MAEVPRTRTSQKHLIRFRREVVPAGLSLKPEDSVKEIQRHVDVLRKIACETITGAGKDPHKVHQLIRDSEVADAPYCAARLLVEINELARRLNRLAGDTQLHAAKARGQDAVVSALHIAWCFDALTVVCSESETVIGMKQRTSLQKGHEKSHQAAERNRAKYQKEAERIWKRNSTLSKVAVARSIREKLRLKLKVPTIADKLKKPPTPR